jgi:MATE family multidrug resistance protein
MLHSRRDALQFLSMILKQQSLLRNFLRLAAVNVLSNLMVPLAGFIDVAFLGHLAEIHHLAGVALAAVLFNYIYWILNFLRMGTTGTTAQAVGRNDRDAVLLIGLRHGLIALVLGLLILLLQQPIQTVGFWLLSATPAVKASGIAYFDALIWSAPAHLLGFVLTGWFLGQGQSGKVLILSAVVSGTNVILDYWFIVRWGWGSAGAGAATALSQYLMVLVGLLFCLDVRLKQVQAVVDQLFNRSALKTVFALNGEIMIRTFALVSTFALFTNLSSSFGTVVLATNALLLQVVAFAAYFIDGLAFATESMAGVLHGGRKPVGLRQLIAVSGGISLCIGLLFSVAFITLPQVLFGLLTNHSNLLTQIPHYVFWLLPVLGFGLIAYMLDGYFLGLTQGRILRQSSVFATLLGFLPVAILAWQLQNVHLLWLALSLFMLTRALTLALNVPSSLKSDSLK